MAKRIETTEFRFEGDSSDLDSAAARARRSLRGVGGESRKTSDRLEGVKFAAQGAGGRIGEMAGRAENMGRAFASLGAAGGPLLLVAGGAAAVTAAIVGMGAAAVGTVVGVVKLTRAGSEAAESLKALQGSAVGLSDMQVSRIEEANEGLDGMNGAAQLLAGTLSSNIAPSVSTITTRLTALGLLGIDVFNELAGGVDLLGRTLDFFISKELGFVQVFASQISGYERTLDLLGLSNNSIKEVVHSTQGWADTLTTDLAPTLGRIFDDSMQDRIDRAIQLGQAMDEGAEAAEGQAQATERQATAAENLLAKQAALLQLQKQQPQTPKADLETSKQAAIAAQDLAAAKAAEADATAMQTRNESHYQAALQGTAQIVGAIPALFKEGTRAAAIATKRSAQAQAVINTALSITSALTIPPPVGPALAIANGIAGAAQIATIEAQPIPANARGGRVDGSAPMYDRNGTGERLVSARRGEFILPPEAVDYLAGTGGGAPVVVELHERNRAVTRSSIRRTSAQRGVFQSRDRMATA